MTNDELTAVASGRTTLAEVEGMTAAQAYSIADFGWTMLEQGRPQIAAQLFEALTLGNPHHAYFFALLGVAYQHAGEADRALEAFARSIELDPREAAALVNRAEILLDVDARAHAAEAVDLIERALALDEQATRPETRRARALAAALADRVAS